MRGRVSVRSYPTNISDLSFHTNKTVRVRIRVRVRVRVRVGVGVRVKTR